MTPSDLPDLDGVRMCAVQTGRGSVVNADAILQLSQLGDNVCARYEGGAIKAGYQVGSIAWGQLEVRSAQRGLNGSLDAGRSESQIEVLDDSKLRLIENFTWHSRDGTGINVFEEI